jgi:hypothetical protein
MDKVQKYNSFKLDVRIHLSVLFWNIQEWSDAVKHLLLSSFSEIHQIRIQ